jgi:Glycosyl transferase family group 2
LSVVPIAVDITPAVVSLSSTSLDAPPVVIRPPASPFAAEARTLALDLPIPLEHEIERPRGMSARQRAVLKRVLEVVPFVVALTVISFLVWGPLFVPVPFAICIISFQAYWLWRAQMTGIHAFKGFLLLRRHKKIDWREQYDGHLAAGQNALKWDDVRHIVVIPNYTESAEKLRLCLNSLAQCEVPEKVIAVLAMEEREGAEGRRRAELLIAEYRSRLGGIFATYHPWGVPGEVAGKASNENWAARRAKETVVDRWGYDLDLLTITSCDADTVLDRKYFSCLTYNFATNPNRYRRFWQGPIMYYNNIWDVPAPLRLPHAIAGLNHLGRLSRTLFRNVFPQSTYSLSLRMAHEVGYWDPDTIPEDWHMFLKCYYTLGGTVEVDTMYTPIYMDGIRSRTYARTFVSYFEQARRHAWGCTDIPYAVQQVLDHPEIPMLARLRRLWALCESHFLWSTQWFLVTLGRVLPFAFVALGIAELPEWFRDTSRWLLTPCAGTLFLIVALDTIMRPRKPDNFRWWHFPFQYTQWFAMAVITLFSSALPALDAQLRLALGKRLEYKVTEKA